MVILAWGSYGIWANDLPVPTKNGYLYHFRGIAAVLASCAMLAVVISLLSLVADHFDVRNNEIWYRRIAFVAEIVGFLIFLSAILFNVLT